MTAAKRKISVSLDEDLVAELESEGEGLSQQINDALRETLDRRRRQRLLERLLRDLDARDGRLPKSLVEKYEELLA